MESTYKLRYIFLVFLCISSFTSLFAQYKISGNCFSGGNTRINGNNYEIAGTVAQTAIGIMDNSSYHIHSGIQGVILRVTPIENFLQNLPHNFELSQNFPNPFNPQTTINYALPKSAYVQIEVFNILGQRVATLVKSHKKAGKHVVQFNAARFPSGLYLYTIKAADFYAVKKMVLTK